MDINPIINTLYLKENGGLKGKMRIIEYFLFELLAPLMLIILPADFLYLYYASGWVEPNKLIATAEEIMLYFFIFWGIILTTLKIRRIKTKFQD